MKGSKGEEMKAMHMNGISKRKEKGRTTRKGKERTEKGREGKGMG